MSKINEVNSSLQGKNYALPLNVITFLKSKVNDPEGSERVTGLLNSQGASYEQLKRFKHDIENSYSGDWGTVINWINSILTRDRTGVDNQKRDTMNIGMENRFKKTHDKNSSLTPLSEKKVMKIKITESQSELLKKEVISEGENFTRYKSHALREMLKEKTETLNKLKEDIRTINDILNKKKSVVKSEPETPEVDNNDVSDV